MKNKIRCWISCFLPCGAFDVIRVVHSSGRVEEIRHPVTAGDIMKINPDHVVRKPSTPSEYEEDTPKFVILHPNTELRRGKIYFLMHISSLPQKTRSKSSNPRRRKRRTHGNSGSHGGHGSQGGSSASSGSSGNGSGSSSNTNQYLTEILSEKISTQKDRRKGRSGVWRPHLESISEYDQQSKRAESLDLADEWKSI